MKTIMSLFNWLPETKNNQTLIHLIVSLKRNIDH